MSCKNWVMSGFETSLNGSPCRYCDGLSPQYRNASALLVADGLELTLAQGSHLHFALSALSLATPYRSGKALLLRPMLSDKARILIEDKAQVEAIVARRPDFKLMQKAGRATGTKLNFIVALFGLVVALAWSFESILPQALATIIPLKWRIQAGASEEMNFAVLGHQCQNASADGALTKLLSVLATGDAEMPNVSVHIYDLSFVNAFALPGGRIIVSNKLIEQAERPEELAGVLAHEIGHVVHADPETQMIRRLSMNLIYDAFGSSHSSGAIAIMEQLRQSRTAEEAADAYARQIMVAAGVDPIGLRDFFSRLLKHERGGPSGNNALVQFGSMFSTHPVTETRIAKIEPLPDGEKAKQVLDETDWQALRKACN
jgi:beta-barrel assembly-enhancing protease